jgi:acyl carrier protein
MTLMKLDEVVSLIETLVNRLMIEKGLPPVALESSTRFLGGDLPLDSLDLAVIVTELEQETQNDPFKDGFKEFSTVGQLAELYID